MDFNIQNKVRVVSYEELPLEARNKAIAKACGKDGEIVDRLYSEAEGGYIYRVHLEGSRTPSTINFTEEMLEPSGGGGDIDVETVIEDNLVIIRMYQDGVEIRHHHAHIFNDGLAGIAQAISYAAKRLCLSFEENKERYGGRR